jgi:hypothetical protein
MKTKKSVSELVYDIAANDETAYESIRRGFMNYSSYAQIIKPKVDKHLDQVAKLNTITASLIRYYETIKNEPPVKPSIPLEKLSIKTPLIDVTYKKIEFDQSILGKIQDKFDLSSLFFAITQGETQVSIITERKIADYVRNNCNSKPIKELEGLGAVICPFHKKYYSRPNIIYSVTSKLALKRVDIIEIISTYTEIVYIVENTQIDNALEVLKQSVK